MTWLVAGGTVRPMPYPIIIVILIAVVAFTIWSRLRLRQGLAQHADKTLGAMTQRMGLMVEAGDPNVNLLYFQQPARDYQRELRARGQPYGRPVTFTLTDGTKTSEYIVMRRITHSFGCFLEAALGVPTPAFEVVQRQPNQYLVPAQEFAGRQELAAVPTGVAQLDALFLIRAADPRLGPALVPALEILATQQFVHLAGEGNSLWMSFTRMGLPYLSYGPEEYLLALESAACGIEGRPAPARLPSASNMPLANTGAV